MYHRQANKTAVQSQHMIADALLQLMQRKPFSQITITELCEEAAVGRKTFYRNFDLKEDIIDFQLDHLCGQYKGEITRMSTAEQLRHHLEYVKKHREWFIALYQNGFNQMVNDKFAALLPITMPVWTNDPIEQQYRSRYIVAGIEAVERVWVERNFHESIDEVVAIVNRVHEQQLPLKIFPFKP